MPKLLIQAEKKKETLSNLGRGLSDNRLLPNLSRNGELEPIF